MRCTLLSAIVIGICGCSTPPEPEIIPARSVALPAAPLGELKIEILSPARDAVMTRWERSVAVRGGASVFGGVRFLDLMLVLDTSKSLVRTDPKNHRTTGAVGLVESLSSRSDVQMGVVDFDRRAVLVSGLTPDGAAVKQAVLSLDRSGSTDLAAGVHEALAELARNARPDSSRVVLLFTDGKTNAAKARQAMEEARRQGVAIHTLLLGSSPKGAAILQEIAHGTGASFTHVIDPERLPEAFLSLRTTGVESVTLSVNASRPIAARLNGGTFVAHLPLRLGQNRIVATATSLDGRTAQREVEVMVAGPMGVTIHSPRAGSRLASRQGQVTVEGEVDAFSDLPAGVAPDPSALGVQEVVLRVNGSGPYAAVVADGRFRGRVPLVQGENRIVAVARSLDGRTAGDAIDITVRSPGCAALEVTAEAAGRPTLSISDRSVEIVFDASNSMWGQIDGTAKIEIAREVLRDALKSMPSDLNLALRVYGHRHRRQLHRCDDSELLVPFGSDSPQRIRAAIGALKPRGQTPLAYSLERVMGDFGRFRGERAVVLVTDGIESCGGDPVRAARALQDQGSFPVHVIGFGLGSDVDEDLSGLRAIARASGGRFLTARNADELRDALAVTVGTPFRVLRGDRAIARGALGDREAMLLPAGAYRVHFDSTPPHIVPVTLASEEVLTLRLNRQPGAVTDSVRRRPADYEPCDEAAPHRHPLEVREGPGPRPPASHPPGR